MYILKKEYKNLKKCTSKKPKKAQKGVNFQENQNWEVQIWKKYIKKAEKSQKGCKFSRKSKLRSTNLKNVHPKSRKKPKRGVNFQENQKLKSIKLKKVHPKSWKKPKRGVQS